jgi:hypothetical protein
MEFETTVRGSKGKLQGKRKSLRTKLGALMFKGKVKAGVKGGH